MDAHSSGIATFPQPHMPGTPYYGVSPHKRQQPQRLEPEQLQDMELFRQLQEWFDEGRDRSHKWREEAEEAADMVAGWQWNQDDVAILNEDGRPSVTFNRMGRNIDLITGQETNTRDEVNFLPREQGDVARSEILSAGVTYIADETDALDEKSDAFRDLCVTGMGWTQTYMNYRDFDQGMPVERRIDPLEMFWDAHAKRRNLRDARWIARAVTLPMREAQDKFPNVSAAMLSAHWANVRDDPSNPSDPDRQSYNYDDAPTQGRPPLLQRVTIIEMEWWEAEKYVAVEDMFSGSRQELPMARAQALMDSVPGRFRGIPRERRVFYKAFLGGILLGKRRMDEVDDFTFQCMTGKRDRRVGWYGLVRAMMDPQRWANKWLSQSMHIMNSNGLGGVLHEEGVFTDPRKAEQNWGKPGSFTSVVEGAISGGRLMQRDVGAFPPELDKLMPLALQSIQDCVGIPDESLGRSSELTVGNRSAAFEQNRREAALTVMATIFDAKRLFMKRQGRVLLSFMLKFMNDGRLVRIQEQGQEKYVPMVFRDPDIAKYDIVVDVAKDSPTEREKTWAIIERFLPFVDKLGAPPKFYADLLPYIPHFPSTLTRSLQQTLIEQQQSQEQGGQQIDPAKQAKAQVDMAKLPHEIEKIRAETQRLMAQAQQLQSAMHLNLAKVQETGARVELDSLEQIRETVALDDAREQNRLSAHEAA